MLNKRNRHIELSEEDLAIELGVYLNNSSFELKWKGQSSIYENYYSISKIAFFNNCRIDVPDTNFNLERLLSLSISILLRPTMFYNHDLSEIEKRDFMMLGRHLFFFVYESYLPSRALLIEKSIYYKNIVIKMYKKFTGI